MNSIVPLEIWAGWIERACEINEYVVPEREFAESPKNGKPAGEDAPGTDFNRRGSWGETGLFEAGWTWERKKGEDAGLLTRPEKSKGVSASIGTVTSKAHGWPLFYPWTTSTDFVAEKGYSRFGVFAKLRHGGDFSAAAKELASRGYGSRMPEVGEVTFGQNGQADPPMEATGRIFKWMSELAFRPANDKWLWHGFISRGGVTMLSALWKAGKSTLLSHLIRAFDGRTDVFLGREIVPSRILYVSEEHEDLWAERRDELNIGDHVGMLTRECLPFRGRSSPAQWASLIGSVVAAVQDHRFDIVILDTISKLWPVREENDAGQVEDALMPLWSITNTGAGLVLVHHNRKSDGKEFTGSRGSGGLPAFCETLVEFRRNSDESRDTKRLLTSAGRYRETPSKWLIDLTPAGYVAHGDPDDMTEDQRVTFGVGDRAKAEGWKRAVLDLLPTDSGQAMTREAIHTALRKTTEGVRDENLRDWLKARTEDGETLQLGRGTKASPYRWYKPTVTSPTPGDGAGDESGTSSESETNDA